MDNYQERRMYPRNQRAPVFQGMRHQQGQSSEYLATSRSSHDEPYNVQLLAYPLEPNYSDFMMTAGYPSSLDLYRNPSFQRRADSSEAASTPISRMAPSVNRDRARGYIEQQNVQYGYAVPRLPCIAFDDSASFPMTFMKTPQDLIRGEEMQGLKRSSSATKRPLDFGQMEVTPKRSHFGVEESALRAPEKSTYAIGSKELRPNLSKQQLKYDSNSNTAAKKPLQKYAYPETVILTANVKCTIEWYSHISNLKKYKVLFEIFALLQRVKECDKYYELLLRDKSGPLLQVLFYKMENPLPELAIGQVVRVIGRHLARTQLQAFSVRAAKAGELQRHDLYLSNQSLIAMKRNDDINE